MDLDRVVALLSEVFRECGHVPSYRPIAAMIQLANGGRGVREARIRELLKNYHGPQSGRDFPSCGPQSGRSGSIFANGALDERVRADLNGLSYSLATASTATVANAPVASDASAAAQLTLLAPSDLKPKRRRASANPPTAEQLAGFAIRDRIADLVRPHLRAMTITEWKRDNGKVAYDMALAGETADSAEAAWREEYSAGYTRIFLRDLRRRMAMSAVRDAKDREELGEFVHPEGGWDNDLPRFEDLDG